MQGQSGPSSNRLGIIPANHIPALGKTRNASVQGMGKVEIGGDVYRALDKLNHAIDDVCAATGRPREHFWAKANSA